MGKELNEGPLKHYISHGLFRQYIPGPEGEACAGLSPIKCFRLFLPSLYINVLLFQTNLYADQQRASKNDNSHFDPIVNEELLAFIGINIVMDVCHFLQQITTGQRPQYVLIHGFVL